MLPRLTATLITLFWAGMWALLIHTEVRPQSAALREVPVEHVVKMMFHHGLPSDLAVQVEKTRLGSLRMLPHIRKEDGHRVLELTGSLDIQGHGAARKRFVWDGNAEWTPELDLEQFRLGAIVRDATAPAAANAMADRFEVTVQRRAQRASWEWRSRGQLVDARSYSLDEAGLRKALAEFALLPTLPPVMQFSAAKATPPRLTAHQSRLRIREEWAETFLVKVEHGGQTWLECHVSQLGQVLHARTLVGWTLGPQD